MNNTDKEPHSGGGTPCRRNLYNTSQKSCFWCVVSSVVSNPGVKAALKFMLLCQLWAFLECCLYGEVQPRTVDIIMSFFLYYYIDKSERLKK